MNMENLKLKTAENTLYVFNFCSQILQSKRVELNM